MNYGEGQEAVHTGRDREHLESGKAALYQLVQSVERRRRHLRHFPAPAQHASCKSLPIRETVRAVLSNPRRHGAGDTVEIRSDSKLTPTAETRCAGVCSMGLAALHWSVS